jgi:signal peptidase I
MLWLLALLALLAVASAGLLLARWWLFAVTVDGDSMEPTLVAGDRLLARRCSGKALRAGQLVVIESPSPVGGWHWDDARRARLADGHWIIKRVAAVPGDLTPPEIPGLAGDRVPEESIIVLGDNLEASIDSRELGPIPVGRVLGVCVRRHPAASHRRAGQTPVSRS